MPHSRQASISSSIETSCHSHPQKIGPWKLGKTLGRGATGRVLLATHQITGQKAAVKVVSKSELHDIEEDEGQKPSAAGGAAGGLPYGIEREIIIMKLLTHPNVLRLYDVWETSKALYLVMEYVEGGELFDLLVERGPLQEREAIKYFRQIILGTAYCHALGICHRDLKPENLLLDDQLNVKLADFGMAALESNGKLLETSCGSPHYAAPEIVSGLKYHGAASDIWSCGVILFALLTGRLPFDDENIRNLLLKVQAGSFEMPDDLSFQAQDLISKMLIADPKRRIKIDLILKHPLLVKYPIPNEDLISEKSLPHPQTAYKSLGSVKNIDKQILSNLSILWHNRSQKEIIDCLLKNGPNPEKTFYALLMRYRHNNSNQEEQPSDSTSSSPAKRSTSYNKLPSTSTTPKKNKRSSRISVSRPTSFQYNRNSTVKNTNAMITSSPQGSPHKTSPAKRYHNYSPLKSPLRQSPRKHDKRSSMLNSIPRNLYNEIVAAQSDQSLPPTLPSKESYYQKHELANVPEVGRPALDDSAKISPSKRNSLMMSTSKSNKRLSKRKSIRASMTLKRNSITMKLLSTYAKISNDNEWEYMDKQTKRTSATFASLCDKIFNHETYDEDEENLVDPEEKQAMEYERLMEIERKKHEAEIKARKELEKRKKRQNRKSLLAGNQKLRISIKDDNEANNSEQDLGYTNGGIINQPKRQSKSIRHSSEGILDTEELTREEVENLKQRSVTQPNPTRRRTPVLTTRRPVSRLDPLWQAYENQQLDEAKDALEQEWREGNLKDHPKKRDSTVKRGSDSRRVSVASKKKLNRESMVSPDIIDDEDDDDGFDFTINKPDTSVPTIEGKRLSKDIGGKKTLIGDVKIPNVTRKSRNFTNSNKRLSVLSLYSTKESYRDLNSFIQDDEDDHLQKLPKLRTSLADRLNQAGLVEVDDEEAQQYRDDDSVLDLDEHLANKRHSYHDSKRLSTTRKYKAPSGTRPSSKIPDLPKTDFDDTFATQSDNVYKNRKSMVSVESEEEVTDDVFDKIKLPDGKSTGSSLDVNEISSGNGGAKKPTKSMLSPGNEEAQSQAYPKVRGNKANPSAPLAPPDKNGTSKKPLEDKTNNYEKRRPSFFRKLSWGAKKSLDEEPQPKSSFMRWFSSSSYSDVKVKKIQTLLPQHEMSIALYSLLNSWTNFGIKKLKNDQVGYNITGTITKKNTTSCKFRIKINPRDFNQKSELVCVKVKGSQETADLLFREIEQVLKSEDALDLGGK
ncbi:Serine/threonine-protein kinase GIN4 [Spathaspora sp. JA1]|nr:Serine/threonine-protein kinase GIN4 [Spathaspora sp. JA1]